MTRVNRRRLIGVAGSVAAHGLVLFALVRAQPEPPRMAEPEPMAVALVAPPRRPEPPPPPPTPEPAPPTERPAPAKPAPRPHIARLAPPSPDVAPVPAGVGRVAAGAGEVSDAEIAGAATAGSGAGAGCNMPARLQAALRKDRLAQAAVAAAHGGRAIRVWNGDWVIHPGQDGGGLAAVREAIMWEVAFAPQACRAEPVHGLVLISLNDGPAPARLVVGSGQWRWSDLLFSGGRARPGS